MKLKERMSAYNVVDGNEDEKLNRVSIREQYFVALCTINYKREHL